MDFGKPLKKKESLKKGMRPFLVQKFSRRDLRLIRCLVIIYLRNLFTQEHEKAITRQTNVIPNKEAC